MPSSVILISLGLAIDSDRRLRRNCAIAILAAAEAVAVYDMKNSDDPRISAQSNSLASYVKMSTLSRTQ